MRTKSWRRHQRQRWINRRLFIVYNFYFESLESWPWLHNGSRLAKWNFTCDSSMCKLNTFYSRKEKRHRENIKHPIEVEYS